MNLDFLQFSLNIYHIYILQILKSFKSKSKIFLFYFFVFLNRSYGRFVLVLLRSTYFGYWTDQQLHKHFSDTLRIKYELLVTVVYGPFGVYTFGMEEGECPLSCLPINKSIGRITGDEPSIILSSLLLVYKIL